jgi:hypothetical protein
MRRAAKVDSTQQGIVEALRRVGVHVEVIGKPVDLLASHRGTWHVLEVKNEEGKNRLTADQVRFIERSQGPIHVVRTPEEAIRAVLGAEVMR